MTQTPAYSHKDIWQAIDRLAERKGYSPSGLARLAGLDATSFNRSKRQSPNGKPRWPSTESIAKILAVTDMNMADFFALAEQEADGRSGHLPDKENVRATPLPCLDLSTAATEAVHFTANGHPQGAAWAEEKTPPFLTVSQAGQTLFALRYDGAERSPFLQQGALLLASPDILPDAQDIALIGIEGEAPVLAVWLQQTQEAINFQTLAPDTQDITIPPAKLAWAARIMYISQ